jgi:hypothetical protein
MLGVVTSPICAEAQHRSYADEDGDDGERNTHKPVAASGPEGQDAHRDHHSDDNGHRRRRSRLAEPPQRLWQRVDDRGPQRHCGQVADQ